MQEHTEERLKTREQRYKDRKWDKMYVSRSTITSKAYLSLKTTAACQMYLIFLSKCRMERVQARPASREKEWMITNNGEIQFTYKEALTGYGISNKRFVKAIDDLVRVGLIDISRQGSGLYKETSLYAISQRWKEFGTDEFVEQKRRKRAAHFGFTKGNKHGVYSRSKK